MMIVNDFAVGKALKPLFSLLPLYCEKTALSRIAYRYSTLRNKTHCDARYCYLLSYIRNIIMESH